MPEASPARTRYNAGCHRRTGAGEDSGKWRGTSRRRHRRRQCSDINLRHRYQTSGGGVACCRLLSPAVACCRLLSPAVACCRLLSPAVACCRLLSPAVFTLPGDDAVAVAKAVRAHCAHWAGMLNALYPARRVPPEPARVAGYHWELARAGQEVCLPSPAVAQAAAAHAAGDAGWLVEAGAHMARDSLLWDTQAMARFAATLHSDVADWPLASSPGPGPPAGISLSAGLALSLGLSLSHPSLLRSSSLRPSLRPSVPPSQSGAR
jgi:hypothetical protein